MVINIKTDFRFIPFKIRATTTTFNKKTKNDKLFLPFKIGATTTN